MEADKTSDQRKEMAENLLNEEVTSNGFDWEEVYHRVYSIDIKAWDMLKPEFRLFF